MSPTQHLVPPGARFPPTPATAPRAPSVGPGGAPVAESPRGRPPPSGVPVSLQSPQLTSRSGRSPVPASRLDGPPPTPGSAAQLQFGMPVRISGASSRSPSSHGGAPVQVDTVGSRVSTGSLERAPSGGGTPVRTPSVGTRTFQPFAVATGPLSALPVGTGMQQVPPHVQQQQVQLQQRMQQLQMQHQQQMQQQVQQQMQQQVQHLVQQHQLEQYQLQQQHQRQVQSQPTSAQPPSQAQEQFAPSTPQHADAAQQASPSQQKQPEPQPQQPPPQQHTATGAVHQPPSVPQLQLPTPSPVPSATVVPQLHSLSMPPAIPHHGQHAPPHVPPLQLPIHHEQMLFVPQGAVPPFAMVSPVPSQAFSASPMPSQTLVHSVSRLPSGQVMVSATPSTPHTPMHVQPVGTGASIATTMEAEHGPLIQELTNGVSNLCEAFRNSSKTKIKGSKEQPESTQGKEAENFSEVTKLKQRVEELEETLRTRQAELEALQAKAAELERGSARCEELELMVDGQKKEIAELREALHEAKLAAQKAELGDKSRADHLDHRLQQVEADCRGLGADNERLTADNQRLAAENAKLQSDVKQLSEASERLREEHREAQHQAGSSQDQVSRAASAARKAEQEKQHAESECVRLAKECEVVQGMLQAQRKDHDERELQLRADKRELEIRVQDQKAKITNLTKAQGQLQDRNRHVESQLENLEEDCRRCDAERRAALAEAELARTELMRATNLRTQEESAAAKGARDQQEMQQRCQGLQSELKRARDQVQQLQQQLQERKPGVSLNSVFNAATMGPESSTGAAGGDAEKLARENKALHLQLKEFRNRFWELENMLKQEQNTASYVTPEQYIKLMKAYQGESLAYLNMRLETEKCDLENELHHCKMKLAEQSQAIKQFQRLGGM